MMRVAMIVALAMGGAFAANAYAQPDGTAEAAAPVAQTIVHDRAALARLRGNSGITLQWISFEDPPNTVRRGHVTVADRGDAIHINGVHRSRDGGAYVEVDGDIAEIGTDYFILDGTITIHDTPDAGRHCVKTGPSRFGVTQNRRYWRLREFEWCDGLTDYIDIYF